MRAKIVLNIDGNERQTYFLKPSAVAFLPYDKVSFGKKLLLLRSREMYPSYWFIITFAV